jgi:hypothetical protein
MENTAIYVESFVTPTHSWFLLTRSSRFKLSMGSNDEGKVDPYQISISGTNLNCTEVIPVG